MPDKKSSSATQAKESSTEVVARKTTEPAKSNKKKTVNSSKKKPPAAKKKTSKKDEEEFSTLDLVKKSSLLTKNALDSAIDKRKKELDEFDEHDFPVDKEQEQELSWRAKVGRRLNKKGRRH